MTPKDWFDREVLKLQLFVTGASYGSHLLRINLLNQELLGCERRSNHDRTGSYSDRRRIRHVIVMSMADQNHIRALDVCCFEAKGRKDTSPIEIRIEQNDLPFVGEFEIGEAGPSNGQRLRVSGELSAG